MSLSSITTLATTTIRAGWTAFNQLISDLSSTSNGKGASCIGVEDSDSNLDADNVEDALAEMYTDMADTMTLADVFNEDPATTTGLTWGYKGGRVRNDNTIYTIADGTVSLTDDATNYIEITPSGTVSRNTTGFTAGYCPIRQVVCADGSQTTSTDKRAWFQSVNVSVETVPDGGTGVSSMTDHGILVGSGTDPITSLAAMTNGQLAIGKTGSDPSIAALTGTANQITITNGAGTITLSITTNPTLPGNTTLGGTLDLGGKLTGGANEIEGSNFDINGGAIDGATLGANSNNTYSDLCEATTVATFGQNAAPTGWTRLTTGDTIYDAAADNAMFCYAKTGNIAQGGSANPQSAHTHGLPASGNVGDTGSSFDYTSTTSDPNTAPYYIEMILAKKD